MLRRGRAPGLTCMPLIFMIYSTLTFWYPCFVEVGAQGQDSDFSTEYMSDDGAKSAEDGPPWSYALDKGSQSTAEQGQLAKTVGDMGFTEKTDTIPIDVSKGGSQVVAFATPERVIGLKEGVVPKEGPTALKENVGCEIVKAQVCSALFDADRDKRDAGRGPGQMWCSIDEQMSTQSALAQSRDGGGGNTGGGGGGGAKSGCRASIISGKPGDSASAKRVFAFEYNCCEACCPGGTLQYSTLSIERKRLRLAELKLLKTSGERLDRDLTAIATSFRSDNNDLSRLSVSAGEGRNWCGGSHQFKPYGMDELRAVPADAAALPEKYQGKDTIARLYQSWFRLRMRYNVIEARLGAIAADSDINARGHNFEKMTEAALRMKRDVIHGRMDKLHKMDRELDSVTWNICRGPQVSNEHAPYNYDKHLAAESNEWNRGKPYLVETTPKEIADFSQTIIFKKASMPVRLVSSLRSLFTMKPFFASSFASMLTNVAAPDHDLNKMEQSAPSSRVTRVPKRDPFLETVDAEAWHNAPQPMSDSSWRWNVGRTTYFVFSVVCSCVALLLFSVFASKNWTRGGARMMEQPQREDAGPRTMNGTDIVDDIKDDETNSKKPKTGNKKNDKYEGANEGTKIAPSTITTTEQTTTASGDVGNESTSSSTGCETSSSTPYGTMNARTNKKQRDASVAQLQ
ncbi:unnamed protein product [Amoebophrya sp. A25]|nr:unnamed protein product [Amoebophrya sp. A25]|eukprot:GSA25T00003988001.1